MYGVRLCKNHIKLIFNIKLASTHIWKGRPHTSRTQSLAHQV